MSKLITLTGPSGVGKTTLVNYLLEYFSDSFSDAIALTTRTPREGEQEGKDYNFLSSKEIAKLKNDGKVAALSTTHGNTYGHTHESLLSSSEDGKTGLVISDATRVPQYKALQNKTQFQVTSLLILPPSYFILGRRVLKRDLNDNIDKTITRERWNTGWKDFIEEGRDKNLYDFEIINSKIEETAQEILEISEA